MPTESSVSDIASSIETATGVAFSPSRHFPVSGGDINRALVLEDGERRFFVKVNRAGLLPMFEAEAEGLAELAATGAVRAPAVVAVGSDDDSAWLVLEYVELQPLREPAAGRLGEALARLHAVAQPFFGWHRNNTIGTTPQPNPREHDWPAFFRRYRLEHQLSLAERNGYGGHLQSLGQQLIECIPEFFTSYTPQPSLLHGDLWGGNAAMDEDARPWLYDPAVYYGDRESDLAMTELFGGFGPAFRAAYEAEWPLDPDYCVRRDLYQLYHVLNHLNLFGGSWAGSAKRLMERLLAEAAG